MTTEGARQKTVPKEQDTVAPPETTAEGEVAVAADEDEISSEASKKGGRRPEKKENVCGEAEAENHNGICRKRKSI